MINTIKDYLRRDAAIILRIPLIVILIMHSIPGILDGGVNIFGREYLDKIGFAPFGLTIAWSIKISHVLCAVLLALNRYILLASLITIFVLIMGIVMVHYPEGWYVVGGGRNGIEFNILLIAVFSYLIVLDRRK